jgi:hypothetical protein
MPFDPDTEIQYRKGGKIMKKTPRKFSAGGTAPAPAPKPAPKGGPKELQDEAEKMRQKEREEKERAAGQRRPNLGQVGLKKGGKVKKYADGGETQAEDKDIFYTGRFKGEDGDDTYRRAYNYADQLRLPPGAKAEKEYEVATAGKPSVRKAAPKAMPKAAPKATPKAETRAEASKSGESLAQGLGRKFAATDMAFRNAPSGTSSLAYSALKKARDDAESAYMKATEAERTGKSVMKLAKGGGVEAKGKTKGKIVKMAKGGSVRGYGISKVTNKTKYC